MKNALAEYNRRAAALRPPRPQLSLDEVMAAVSLAELDLLRYTRTDIREEDWAKPANRQAMNLHQRVAHARGEIARLNVEGPRLLTFLVDRYYDFHEAITSLNTSNPHLSYEIQLRRDYDERVST